MSKNPNGIHYKDYLTYEQIIATPKNFQLAYVEHLIYLGHREISDFAMLFQTGESEIKKLLYDLNRYKNGSTISRSNREQENNTRSNANWEKAILGNNNISTYTVSYEDILERAKGIKFAFSNGQSVKAIRNLIEEMIKEAQKVKNDTPLTLEEFNALNTDMAKTEYIVELANRFGVSLSYVSKTLYGDSDRKIEKAVYKTLKSHNMYKQYSETTPGQRRCGTTEQKHAFDVWAGVIPGDGTPPSEVIHKVAEKKSKKGISKSKVVLKTPTTKEEIKPTVSKDPIPITKTFKLTWTNGPMSEFYTLISRLYALCEEKNVKFESDD